MRVSDAANWTQMSGQSVLIKQLNSLITINLVGRFNVEADASLVFAESFASLSGREKEINLLVFQDLGLSFGQVASEELLGQISAEITRLIIQHKSFLN